MNNFSAGQPPPPAPPKRPFPLIPAILGGAALLIVLAVVGGIKGFQAAEAGSAEAAAVGNSFIDNLGQHNYGAARSLFAPEVQSKTQAGDLRDIEALVEKRHGAFVNHGQPSWFVQNMNGQTSVRLTYSAQFTKTDCGVSLILIPTDGGYRVQDAHYDL